MSLIIHDPSVPLAFLKHPEESRIIQVMLAHVVMGVMNIMVVMLLRMSV